MSNSDGQLRSYATNAATDAPKGKGGEAVARAARIQDNAMLNVAERPQAGKVASQFIRTSEDRKAALWLNERVAKAQMGIICEVVEITPAMARVLLERNPDNRRVSEATVDKIARDIENGTFSLNGESIIVARDGTVNDGQHRLLGCIVAKRAFPTVMVFGPERDTRVTVDQGRSKMVADFLAMEGHADAVALAAAASYVWQWQTRGRVSNQQADRPTKGEVLAVVDAHPSIAASVAGIPNKGSIGLGGRGLLSFCHWAFALNSTPQEASAFIAAYTSGANLLSRDPVLYARNRIMAEGRRLSPGQKAELIFRAWNARRRGETPKTMPILDGPLPAVER